MKKLGFSFMYLVSVDPMEETIHFVQLIQTTNTNPQLQLIFHLFTKFGIRIGCSYELNKIFVPKSFMPLLA